ANNAQVQSYAFTHSNVAGGKHYYRIYQTDADGKSVYSNVAEAIIKQAPVNVRLLSNPVSSSAQVEINTTSAANASIELLSLSGAHISLQQQGLGAGTNTLQVAMGNLARGNYLLKVTVNDVVQVLQVSKL
ncbi:MAG TPA: T9SS type A sorting domain-containing protein, partial [Chitinophagaceae bacterium]